MSANMSLDEIEAMIRAKSPREIFGEDIAGELKRFRVMCHPDRYPDESERANAIIGQLVKLADEAKEPLLTLKSPTCTYTLERRLAVGDVADVHLGESKGNRFIVKASRVPGGANALRIEATVLKTLADKAGATHYGKYFPTLVETFGVKDKIAKQVNVTSFEPEFLTLDDLKRRLPDGLGGRHLAWIFKRLITAIGFAHRSGTIHGAVLPTHVMIRPRDHSLQLIGWGQSVPVGQRITSGSSAFLDWYPPEVKSKVPASPATDIYMAATLMAWLSQPKNITTLVSPNVPEQLRRFFRSCMLEGQSMRPTDAWALLDQFEEALRYEYGAPKFVELRIP